MTRAICEIKLCQLMSLSGMNRFRADLLLLLSAFFWGTSFLGQKTAGTDLGPLTVVGLRYVVAGLLLLPLAIAEARKSTAGLARRDWYLVGLIGLCAVGGNSFEQWGLASTSVTNAGFLTALYVMFVPFAVWGLRRIPPTWLVLLACVICLLGAWLLTAHGVLQTWTQGDVLVAAADLFWAMSIALIDLFLESGRPFLLCVAIDAIIVLPTLAAGLLWEPITVADLTSALPSTLYAGAAAGIAGGLQVVAQKHTPPAEAGLIMALQCVFAALAGALFLGDMLTLAAAVGCGLILLAVVMVEMGPPFYAAPGLPKAESKLRGNR
jgi:drug/metabolite transporter (DMT)-like permease